MTFPDACSYFSFCVAKNKSRTKEKGDFFQTAPHEKRGSALVCYVSQFAYWLHDAEIIAAVGGYRPSVCVGAARFYCAFFRRFSGKN